MILKSDQDYLRVRGSAISDLILALDGATPTTTLARIHGVGRIDEVLRILGRRGLLARNDQPPGRSPSTADPGVLGRSVVATCPVARWFASALGSVTHPLRADARIVITDSYLRPELVAAPAEGGPWLLVKVGTGSVWVSPVFAEGRAPCWNCVRTRILARDDRLALLLYGGYRQVTLALGLDRLYRAARALLQTGDEATVARWRDIVTESELAFREIYADLRGRAARQLAHRRDRRHPRGIRYCARPGRATVQDPLRRHGQAHGPAGICSILRKAGDAITTVDPALPLHPAERALALALDAFGDTLTEVGWLAWAQRSRLPEFVTLAKTIKKYLALIHNTLDLRRCRSSMPPRRRIRPSVAA